MKTNSNLPNSKGFREVEVVQEYEIVSTKTTDELVLEALAKHPMAVFQLAQTTKIPNKTIDSCMVRLLNAGLVTKRPLVIRIDGRRRNVVEYRLRK